VAAQYDKTIDRESAFEVLRKRAEDAARAEAEQQEREDRGDTARPRTRTGFQLPDFGGSRSGRNDDRYDDPPARAPRRTTTRRSSRQTVTEAAIKSVTRSVASSLGRALVRGILGSLKKGF
jgi:hypothetical protein